MRPVPKPRRGSSHFQNSQADKKLYCCFFGGSWGFPPFVVFGITSVITSELLLRRGFNFSLCPGTSQKRSIPQSIFYLTLEKQQSNYRLPAAVFNRTSTTANLKSTGMSQKAMSCNQVLLMHQMKSGPRHDLKYPYQTGGCHSRCHVLRLSHCVRKETMASSTSGAKSPPPNRVRHTNCQARCWHFSC